MRFVMTLGHLLEGTCEHVLTRHVPWLAERTLRCTCVLPTCLTMQACTAQTEQRPKARAWARIRTRAGQGWILRHLSSKLDHQGRHRDNRHSSLAVGEKDLDRPSISPSGPPLQSPRQLQQPLRQARCLSIEKIPRQSACPGQAEPTASSIRPFHRLALVLGARTKPRLLGECQAEITKWTVTLR